MHRNALNFSFLVASFLRYTGGVRPEVEKFPQYVVRESDLSAGPRRRGVSRRLLLPALVSASLASRPKTDEQISHASLTETRRAQLLLMNDRCPRSPFKKSLSC